MIGTLYSEMRVTVVRALILASLAGSLQAVALSRQKRVIGGLEFESGKWPWLVSLQGKVPDITFFGIPLTYKYFYCGASILNDRWIMTAAHCFKENDMGSKALNPIYWHAKLGDIVLESSLADKFMGLVGDFFDIDDFKDWYLHASQIVIHPGYDADTLWLNDIALLKLEDSIPTSATEIPEIQAVRLPLAGNTSFPASNQICVMKGWGCTQSGGPVTVTAREVPLPVVSPTECANSWGIVGESRICAGRNLGAMGICSGDSGGPLVCQNEAGRWVQVGIASFTSANRPGQVPGVFSRVSYYINWINSIIGIRGN